jgi:hypothetical protein
MKNNIRDKFIKDIYFDCETGEIVESFSDKELGINKDEYLNEDGHFKDFHGGKYNEDRDYQAFKKFFKTMKATKDDFDILRSYYHKDNDYSFMKSPSLRHLLLDEPLPQKQGRDKYFVLLDIEIRKIMQDLIALLKKTKDEDLKDKILAKIKKIKSTDYIFTKRETDETFMPLLIYEKES